MLSVADWAEIRRLHHAEGPPQYSRPAKGSVVDEVEPRIRELLQAWPTMPATVIAERLDWSYSIRVLRDRVAELRPVCLPPDPASRTNCQPGEIGQCDLWFPNVEIPVGFGQRRLNTQLAGWLPKANSRLMRVLGCSPAGRIEADRAAMLQLPPVPPATGWRSSLRLPRDHYIRLDSNDYSVHPTAVGGRIEVTADLDRVRVFCGGRPVADHPRCWARHQSATLSIQSRPRPVLPPGALRRPARLRMPFRRRCRRRRTGHGRTAVARRGLARPPP